MPSISSIKLPNGTSYDVEDNSGTKSSHLHDSTSIVPIVSKTYDAYTISADDVNNGVIFFGTVTINDTTTWQKPWSVHYRLTVTTTEANTQGVYDCWFTVDGSTVTYKNFNGFYSTSYYPIYHHGLMYPKSGYSSEGAHLGMRVYSARTPTTLARVYKVEILEAIGCSVTLKDSLTKYSALYNSTKFYYTEYNGTTLGLQETGDADNTDNFPTYAGVKTGAQGVWAASLFMEDGAGTYQNICTASDGTATSSNRTTATTKKANTNGFKVGGTVWYSSTNYNANSNMSSWGSNRSGMYSVIDTRYSFNTQTAASPTGLTTYLPLYLVGTINSTDGLFYLDTTWWTQTPTTTGKVYVLVGGVYDITGSGDNRYYRFSLFETNPWYYYDGTRLRQYNLYAANAGSVAWSNISSKPTATDSKVTGISISDHGTTSVGSASNWSAGTASTWAFEEKSIPNVTSAGSASTWAFEEKTIPNVTAAGSGSASLTFTMDTTDTKKLKIAFSHSHTAPTLGTAIKVQSKSSGSNGSAPTLGTAIKVQSKKSGSNSTVPSLTVTSTTVVNGKTHSITDNGHTHTLS